MTFNPTPISDNIEIHHQFMADNTAKPDVHIGKSTKNRTFWSIEQIVPMVREIENRFAESGIADHADEAQALIRFYPPDNGSDHDITEVWLVHMDGNWKINDIKKIPVGPGAAGIIEVFLTDAQFATIRENGKSTENYLPLRDIENKCKNAQQSQ